MNTALNELRELERQSTAKHAPDVVLDTLEQVKNSPTPATSTESLSPLHSVALRSTEPQIRRSTSSSSDTMSTFKPMVAPRMGVQLKPQLLGQNLLFFQKQILPWDLLRLPRVRQTSLARCKK